MLISKFNITNVESEIIKFEEKYNFKFPHQYKEFLLPYNGGIIPKTEFCIKRVDCDLSGLIGFGEADGNTDRDFRYWAAKDRR